MQLLDALVRGVILQDGVGRHDLAKGAMLKVTYLRRVRGCSLLQRLDQTLPPAVMGGDGFSGDAGEVLFCSVRYDVVGCLIEVKLANGCHQVFGLVSQ